MKGVIKIKNTLRQKKDRQAVILIIVLSLLSISAMFTMYKLESSKVQLDKITLCPLNREIGHHTVVVLDKSDEWEQQDIDRMEGFLSDVHRSIPEYGQLTFVVITGDKGSYTKAVKKFDMCNPGNGENSNQLYTNPMLLKKRYDDSFGVPLREIIKTLVAPDQSSSSPLFETIVSIIDDNKSKYLQIHMISDLMENGSKFRFYDVVPWYQQVIMEYPIYTDAQVSIHAHTIDRRRHSRGLMDAVESVWQEYCNRQNVSIDFKRLIISE